MDAATMGCPAGGALAGGAPDSSGRVRVLLRPRARRDARYGVGCLSAGIGRILRAVLTGRCGPRGTRGCERRYERTAAVRTALEPRAAAAAPGRR